MSQEEARLLLAAWNYFDSHPKEKFWEGLPGMPRDEFYRWMSVITGIENLVEAKNYLGRFAQGEISETVPGTIIEKAKEGSVPKPYVEDAKRATTSVRAWLKNIKPKGPGDPAFREVLAAQLKAELARIEKARAPILIPKMATAPLPSEEPVSLGIKITPARLGTFQKFTARVATLPVRTAIEWSRPTLTASEPQRAAALTLWARGISSEKMEEKAGALEDSKKARLLELIKAIKNEEQIFSVQTQLLRRAFPIEDITFLLGPESGLTQAQVAIFFAPPEKVVTPEAKEKVRLLELIDAIKNEERISPPEAQFLEQTFPTKDITFLLGPESGLTQAQVAIFFAPPEKGSITVSPRQPLLGNLFSRVGQRLFGKASSRFIKGLTSRAAAKLGLRAAAAAAGAPGGPPGIIAGFLASFIPDALSWLKRNFSKVAMGLGALVLAAGFVLQSAVLMAGGALVGFGGLVVQVGGVGPALSSATGFASSVISGITSFAVSAIATPLIVALISIPIAVAIILFIINSGAYIVPPTPVTDVPFGFPVECTAEKAPVSFPNSTSSPIAKRAWEITSDLYQGFWCYWNRSPGDFPEDTTDYPPSYPELFNASLFAKKPNPTRDEVSSCGECLFWCTWLVQKAYRENGVSIQYTLWSPTMQADFTRRGKFISASQATPSNVKPGAVIFFDVKNSLDRTDHTGIVHSINIDGISYVQSNAGTKDGFVPFGSSGGLQNIPGIDLVGIGNP